jgi:hypothetical protein
MKILNTLHDLWRHSLFCPICQDYCRDVSITVGPDFVFELVSFEKVNDILYLNCTFKRKREIKYKINYTIQTLTNKFDVNVIEVEPTNEAYASEPDEITKASKAYFFFYLHGDCRQCDSAHSNSSDIELNMTQKVCSNIGIERDGIYLLKHKDKYHITIAYDSDNMLISKCFEDEEHGIVDDNKIFECPIANFDFSNPERVINKIKTLMIFS